MCHELQGTLIKMRSWVLLCQIDEKKKISTVRSNDFSVSGVKINKNKKLFAAFVWVSYRIILNKQIVKKN